MMKSMLVSAAALMLGANLAAADAMTDTIQRDLSQQGFKNIEFSADDGQLTVEAARGNQTIELVYDTETGELLSRDGEKLTGLERAEQVSGKSLPQGRGAPDTEDDDGPGRGKSADAGDNGRGNAGRGGADDGAGDNGRGNAGRGGADDGADTDDGTSDDGMTGDDSDPAGDASDSDDGEES